MNTTQSVHPLGTRAKVLLSGVFGPYAQNDEYGSREINPMELYHNQVTRVQGPFSLRMFHRSFGLLMLQSNIDAPCTVLDFPSLDRFIAELEQNSYDIVGISSIIPNVGKVKKMCELIRKHQPNATILVGGHVTNKDNIHEIIDADHIVRGEGVRWFRKFLGQDADAPIRHPLAESAFGGRIMGYSLPDKPGNGNTAAILLPSVGCPVGCNFCSTSALFGGKGKFINFYETGDALFNVMCQLEKKLNVRSFFTMDENFLLHRKRALRLLELMEENNKSWSLMIFSSARVLQSYDIEQLVRMGISWVWMGMEGEESQYKKLRGVDTHSLVKFFQSHGIRVLGSSIIGMENHTPENIDRVIEYAVSHNTDFHQFMIYTPNSGTPLYEQHKKDGTLFPESEFPPADTHGQYRFNFRHKHIHDGQEEQFLINAFTRDFEVNGPSLARLFRTMLKGWERYKDHPDKCIRDRFEWEVRSLRTTYAGAAWAMRKWYQGNEAIIKKLDSLLRDIYRAFGWKTRLIAPLIGRYIYILLKKEDRRLAKGWTYEPECFYEKNAAAIALEKNMPLSEVIRSQLPEIEWVSCEPSPVLSKS
ncbi:B12-binding domain-containing radical SAM protein [Desulfonema magnum]|uniref:B12-binding radical SAM domain-containing protein n=1 Tax=Desulfonema magnum TaxID=45655 RepID=A0A975BJZ0_9BACT|nr:cobalamin-dependent protein [Desulfonema magnum]QTA86795.1 B12-binding radical SAM domain-containing protein [Desulfonema magnum]